MCVGLVMVVGYSFCRDSVTGASWAQSLGIIQYHRIEVLNPPFASGQMTQGVWGYGTFRAGVEKIRGTDVSQSRTA